MDKLTQEKEKKDPILISLICNILLMLGKGITGLLANSNALIADALHSLTDVSVFLINYRVCKDCKMYCRIDKKRASEKISQKIVDIEVCATYYAGILLLTLGMAICFHNLMILVLDKAQKPDLITFIVAIITLAAYGGLYRYLEDTDDHKAEDCVLASKNTHWQNKMNLFSGTVVVAGLAGAMSGFIFMDELAAVVVGSIMLSLGIKWIVEARENFNGAARRYFKFVIIGSVLTAVLLTCISLSVQIR